MRFLNHLLHILYTSSLSTIILVMLLSLLLFATLSTVYPKFVRRVSLSLYIFSVCAILLVTNIGRTSINIYQFSFIPFVRLNFTNESFRMYVMNAFLFFPYGLFLPYALPERVKHPIRITIFSALFFSLIIETIQLIFRLGTCETDDVIMNTLGATIGSLSYILSNWLRKRKEKRKVENT